VEFRGRRFANDLLPLPYTEEALRHVSSRIAQAQDFLGRRILIENVSSYLLFSVSRMPEWVFPGRSSPRNRMRNLLDLNNIYVAARNFGFDAQRYLDARGDPGAVRETSISRPQRRRVRGQELLHRHARTPVCDAVWNLYRAPLRGDSATCPH